MAGDWCSGVRLSIIVLTVCSAVLTYNARSLVLSTYVATRRNSNPTYPPQNLLLDGGRLHLHIEPSGTLEIKTSRGILVAASGSNPYIRADGRLRRLVLKAASPSTGCDTIGCFTAVTLEWRMAPENSSVMLTRMRAYAGLDALVFSTSFPRVLHGTSSGRPCGFIGGPAAGLYNDCGLASAFPRLALGEAYRRWLSWGGGGNSPEPTIGSFDAMIGQSAFLKDEAQGGGGGGGGRVARGFLTLAYDGSARTGRTVQQELDAISLEPPWGKSAVVSFSRAKTFCLAEPRCKGFSWQATALGGSSPTAEPLPGEMIRVRWPVTNRPTFVTDTPADGRGRVPLAFYESSAATNLGGLVAAPIVLPCAGGLNDTIALTPLSSFMSTSHEYDVSTGSLDLGVLGSVGSVPAGFEAEWLMTVDDGFNSALRKAGAAVLRRAGTAAAKRAHAAADVSLNSLGYATQQGAWYYYNTAPRSSPVGDAAQLGGGTGGLAPAVGASASSSTPRMWGERFATSGVVFGCAVNVSEAPPKYGCKSYSETIIDVKRRADEVALPYRWWLMECATYQPNPRPCDGLGTDGPLGSISRGEAPGGTQRGH